jgi:hypothetical protein
MAHLTEPPRPQGLGTAHGRHGRAQGLRRRAPPPVTVGAGRGRHRDEGLSGPARTDRLQRTKRTGSADRHTELPGSASCRGGFDGERVQLSIPSPDALLITDLGSDRPAADEPAARQARESAPAPPEAINTTSAWPAQHPPDKLVARCCRRDGLWTCRSSSLERPGDRCGRIQKIERG